MNEQLSSLGFPLWLITYGAAVVGSFGVELAALVRDLSLSDGVLPRRYRTYSYPIFRVLFAFLAAGPLALMLEPHSALTAFYVGVSAPLIYDRAASGIRLVQGSDVGTADDGGR